MLNHLTNTLLVFILASCSSAKIATLSFDMTSASQFGQKVVQGYSNYADTSGYREVRKVAFNRRGPDEELMYLFRPSTDKEEIIIYTFDRRDSCILYSGYLNEDAYLIQINSIPIPRGRYLIKIGNSIDSLDHN